MRHYSVPDLFLLLLKVKTIVSTVKHALNLGMTILAKIKNKTRFQRVIIIGLPLIL